MKMTKYRLAWLAALSVSACGASSAPRSAPAVPAQPANGAAAPAYAAPPPPVATAAPAPGAAEAAPATADAEQHKASKDGASVQLGEARHELSVALGQADCKAACRALASMEKATRQGCEPASSADERDQCQSAEKDLGAAKGRVRAACGACGTQVR
jgi:hypothetical protein